jgi:hypothetical protein
MSDHQRAADDGHADPRVFALRCDLLSAPGRLTHLAARAFLCTMPRAAHRSAARYRDAAFIDSADARPLRILAEYLHPLHAFEQGRVHDTIVFFGSARLRADGPLGRYYAEARELARLVTEWSLDIRILQRAGKTRPAQGC